MDWGTHGITDIGKLFSKNEYVPHGLIIYIICEVYIDDMLTDWGGIPQEHRDRLRKITGVQCDIEPFINHVVLTTISFVGHGIDSEGINMSQKRVESTIDVIRPTNLKELYSFIGVVNYFHDHIPHHATVAKPLT